MSKVQTFEEWVVCNNDFSADPFIAARQAWQAAHENAARVCEATGADWPRNQWVETGADGCDACASAIREAAK